MRTALLSLLVASLFRPWPVEAIHVPEVSLDLPRDHVCIHRHQVPGNYGSTTTFVYGKDVSTNQLFALAVVAAEWVQFCPTGEQLAGAVQEYEEEHLADAIHHPMFRRGFLDITALFGALYHQRVLGRSGLVAERQVEFQGRPLRVYYVDPHSLSEAAHWRGRIGGNNVFVNLDRIRHESGGNPELFEMGLVSTLHHEQVHWLTTRHLEYGEEDPTLLQWVWQTSAVEDLHFEMLAELGPALASIARGRNASREMERLLDCLAGYQPVMEAGEDIWQDMWQKSLRAATEVRCALLRRFLREQGFKQFYIERQAGARQRLNGGPPNVLDLAWIREDAESALAARKDLYLDYVAFFNTLDNGVTRSWAKQTYERCFGEMVELPDDIPPEVVQWFQEERHATLADNR